MPRRYPYRLSCPRKKLKPRSSSLCCFCARKSCPMARTGCMSSFLIKFDGYRALAIKSRGKVQLRSRNDNDFSSRYLGIVKALAAMPDETVIDGEVVALDEDGRPSFNLLQNYGSAGAPLHFFIFDVLVLKGRGVMGESLTERRRLLEKHVF